MRNHAKEILEAGGVALGFGLRISRTAEVARIAKACDHDWLQIDMEHSPISLETASDICAAALDVGVTPIVRVPGHEHHHASRALDAGAMGVQFPHVRSAGEARELVSSCKFPPQGHRPMWGTYAQLDYAEMSLGDMAAILNANTLVIVMIEETEGLQNMEEIAGTDGVDVVFLGANDMMAELGLHGQFDDPKIAEMFGTLIDVCRKYGKYAGMGGITDVALMRQFISDGVQWVSSVSDLKLILKAGREQAEAIRAP
jgi:4-hydroxy-2-oxoheptanedioate aldolase